MTLNGLWLMVTTTGTVVLMGKTHYFPCQKNYSFFSDSQLMKERNMITSVVIFSTNARARRVSMMSSAMALLSYTKAFPTYTEPWRN